MREFCESLPADRLLQGNDSNLEAALDKERDLRVFVDPESGAKLTYASSLGVLAQFVACLVSSFYRKMNLTVDFASRMHLRHQTTW